MQQVSLYDLNEYIKRVIALNFQEPVWVHAELSQVNEVRGQVYLDLVHHDESTDEITAQASAVIWYKSHLFLKNKLKELLPSILQVGTKVLVKARIEFTERYGLKLVIEDIDPSYTIGQMEMNRQKIMQQLQDANVTHLNKSQQLTPVIQTIAVISSATAAGYKDFLAQLTHNEYGYKYSTTLFAAAMQGQNTEREVCGALDAIRESENAFDCVVIIRGGGSKLDLSAFDNYNIGHKIASFQIPVYTGIGHEIDSCVADLVAHTSFKTPTAVATSIIDRALHFEADILSIGQNIGRYAHQMIGMQNAHLENAIQLLRIQPKAIVANKKNVIQVVEQTILQHTRNKLLSIRHQLESAEQIIRLSDPTHILKKGYTLILKEGEVVTSVKDLKTADNVVIKYSDGDTSATII